MNALRALLPALALLALLAPAAPALDWERLPGVERVLDLPPGPDNPRNSEGAFLRLKDGRILFVYTKFTGGGGDHDTAFLAGRVSADGGKTWTGEDAVVLPNEGGMNIMSVSLLRMGRGDIGLFYLRKNSEQDCRPYLRVSSDEGATWSEPRCIVESPVSYYVVNNDRIIRLKSGRIVIPAARHDWKGKGMDGRAHMVCFLSDDDGATWRPSESVMYNQRVMLQEPGVVELKDGRLMMFIRTDGGSQYLSWSEDGGSKWTEPVPGDLKSPLSPASNKRIPATGDLLAAWNDHEGIAPELAKARTPSAVALSKDEGKTWTTRRNLSADPNGWYCYTALEFVDGHVLLAQCAGDRRQNGLARTWVLRFPVKLLYGE